MGAGRGRLVWVSLTESLLLAVPGALAGLLLSQWAIDAMVSSFPEDLPYWLNFGMDWRVAIFTLVTAAFTTIAVGLLPSLRGARPDLVKDLKEGGRGVSLGRGGQRLQAALAVSQVALCFGLLVGADLMVRSFLAMQTADLGFDHRSILSARGYLAGDAYDEVPVRAAFYRQAVTRLSQLPGVTAAAATTAIPGDDGGGTRRLVVDGRTAETDEIGIHAIGITPSLFDTLGLPIVSGRTFTEREAETPGAGVAMLNQSLANRLWPGESAVGRRLTSESSGAWYTVVGVVEDILQNGFDGEPEPLIYLPLVGPTPTSWVLTSPAYVVKTTRAEAIGPEIRALAREAAPTAPMYRTFTMAGLAEDSMTALTFMALAVGIASVLALVLGAVGLYGVLSYVVAQRTREIGVRMALGAEASGVRRMVVVQGARVVLTGVGVGLAVAAATTQALEGMLFRVEPADVTTFAAMSVGMVLVGMVASYLPARRASSVDPVQSLKS
jgi:predicted permease